MFTSMLISLALAEGTDTLGSTQALRSGTVLQLDVLNAGEAVQWTGDGAVAVTRPDGSSWGTLDSAGSFAPDVTGSWSFEVVADQAVGTEWDLSVLGEVGRLWSRSWRFNAGSFAESAATNGSFYAKVPSGPPGTHAVIELNLRGLAGFVYSLEANGVGIEGAGSVSTPEAGNTVVPEFPLYVQPPEDASYSTIQPAVSDIDFEGGTGSASVLDGTDVTCEQVLSGGREGIFSFVTDVEGTARLLCDLDGDGVMGGAGTPDLSMTSAVSPGSNTIGWDGLDRYGNVVPPGDYDCQVDIRSGEFHYVGADIETSYEGFRLFEVALDGTRTPLAMHWDDTPVQSAAVLMPNGEVGRVSSPPEGVMSGATGDPVVPNVNARSWGEFAGSGKGNLSLLDTSTWLANTSSTRLTLGVTDGVADGDGDGLSDYEEACVLGSDPTDPDSDGDGTDDGEQYGASSSSGFNGGLESNGDFATALAERLVVRTRYGRSPSNRRSRSELQAWVPDAPLGMTAVPATPDDLVGFTEAESVVGVDFVTDGRVRAALLMIETESVHYSHTKAICDRAAGKVLSEVAPVANNRFHSATLVDPKSGLRDHASTWVAIEESDGWTLHSAWLVDDLPALEQGQRAVQIQAWSSVPGGERTLLAAVAEQLGGSWASAPVASFEPIRQVASWGNTLDVDGPDGWRFVGMGEDGERFERLAGEELPPFVEGSVILSDGTHTIDRAWVSDGTWLSGEACTPRTDRPKGVALAGCAAGDGTLIRTLRPARELSGSVSFHTKSAGRVCVESATVSGFACADAVSGWNQLAFDSFEGDVTALQSVDLLTFQDVGAVSGLTMSPFGVETREERGCQTGTGTAVAGWMGLLFLGLRRRRD